MMNVFVDTNILLDHLLMREPFVMPAAKIWTLAETGGIHAFVSAITFNNVYYLVEKYKDRKTAELAIQLMKDVYEIVGVDRDVVFSAMAAGFPDFEDAIQYECALRCRAEILITRNIAHFPVKNIKIMSSADFIQSF